MKEWPKTPNGKIDRNALPRPTLESNHTVILPNTELEKQIQLIWKTLLKKENIGIEDNFFEVGGNSLLAAQLVVHIRNLTHYDLALGKFLENPTIRGVSKTIQNVDHTEINWEQEISLAPDIKTDLPINHEPYQNVLVTGGTGFLGAYLISELLKHRDSLHCYCLVRADNSKDAFEKLRENLKKYSLWNDCYEYRLHAIIGNLSASQLGIQSTPYELLARDIDAIYHNGAEVNFAYTYNQLKPANVLSVSEILKLAALYKNKPIHYISTFSAADETKIPTYGYAQSKWVAEKLLFAARNQGFTVNIYRPGRITGDLKTGIVNGNDLVWRMMKGAVQLKKAPNFPLEIDFTPVDYVSKIIIELSFNPLSYQKNYTIVNQQYLSLQDIITALNKHGFGIITTDYDSWKTALLSTAVEGKENDMLPFIDFLENHYPKDAKHTTMYYDDSAIFALLDRQSHTCPASKDLIDIYLDYLIKTNYI